MLKNKKAIIIAIIIILITGCIVGIISYNLNVNNSSESDNDYGQIGEGSENQESDNDYQISEGYNSSLALEQQKIVFTADDPNGDKYEIVANLEETYEGSQLLVGVVKNGKWLIEPTNDCPLIKEYDENDRFYEFAVEKWGWWSNGSNFNHLEGNEKEGTLEYLSNGVFYHVKYYLTAAENKIPLEIWDVENNKYEILFDTYPVFTNDLNTHENRVLLKKYIKDNSLNPENDELEFYILDTKYFELLNPKASIDGPVVYCTGINDGVFYLHREDGLREFYNDDGEKMFDIRDLDIENDRVTIYDKNIGAFFDNKCDITVSLDSGSEYIATIDKSGTVIDRSEIFN